MKILWMSDSPTSPSGFGNVTRFVCAGLAEHGDQISILGWQARGAPIQWGRCTLYPVRHDGFGADVLLHYLRRIQPDVLVALADVWWLTFITEPTIATFLRTACIPWALYYPIDGDMGDGRLPPSWVQILNTVDLPIAMSEYGRDVTRVNGIQSAYIPHGVATDVFTPPRNKDAAKRALGYDGKFVILSDARNQPRKRLPRLLEIFRRFSAGKHDAVLHLHTDPNDPSSRAPDYSYELKADIEFLGLQDKVRITDSMSIEDGLPLARLAQIYQAADVHLLASLGEGFGLPTLQAASAGVPPLASDYTASRELTRGHGEPIKVKHFIEDQFGLRRALIDIDDAVAKLEQLYGDRERLRAKSDASRHFAERYDWNRVTGEWRDLLHREVPRLRAAISRRPAAARVTVGARQPSVAGIAATVQRALPTAGDNVRITIDIVESQAGKLTAEVFHDAQASDRMLSIPTTLPSANPTLAKRRLIGCVYAAGEADIDLVRTMSRLFPGLKVWSSEPLLVDTDPVTEEAVRFKAVPANSAAWRRYLAASTLALDLGGTDPMLPLHAAELGVPCVGVRSQRDQLRLWPELTVDSHEEAADRCRSVLTDQGVAAQICTRAREMLVATAT